MPTLPALSGADLENPAEAKAGVHELHDPQQEFQGVHIPIKAVSQVDVLHLCRPGDTETQAHPGPGAVQCAAA